jgi:hypothetical protein
MTLELIGGFTLLIGVLSWFMEPAFIVYFFFCSTLLGSAAAFVLDALGGTNISPAHLLLGFLTLKLLSDKRISAAAMQAISFGRPGFWLLVTVIYSIIGAYSLPRLLAGQTLTFAVRAENPFSAPLAPAMSNLTQSIYFTADFVCFVILSGYASTIGGRRVLGKAALACAVLNLIFGALDVITYFTNTADLFSFIRNANYALLNDTEISGLKRIVGSFTEASSYASATLCYFAFTSRLWILGVKPRLTFPLALLSLCTVLLSTATTGYVGLAIFFSFSYLEAVFSMLLRPVTFNTKVFVVATPFLLAILALIIALDTEYSTYIGNLLDGMIFNKLSTASGVERSAWNSQALQNFFDTFGFGVGNGSVRASSFPIAILASLGAVGALIFGLFFATLFFQRSEDGESDALDRAYRQAAKMACFAWLITATISGALIDLGLSFYVFASLSSARQLTLKGVRTPIRAVQASDLA